jgi:CRP/FNR family transcriptional regulator
LDAESLTLLQRAKVSHAYRKGQAIFYEGTPALGIHCLREGRVKTLRSSAGGRTRILRIESPGALLGIEDVFAEAAHSTTAEMLEDGAACFVDRAAVHEIFRTHPETARSMARELALLCRSSEEECAQAGAGGVRERVARVLLKLAHDHGRLSPAGVAVTLGLTREEIAEIAGIAVETTIRQISAFREERLLETSGREITILRMDRLAHIAHRPDQEPT